MKTNAFGTKFISGIIGSVCSFTLSLLLVGCGDDFSPDPLTDMSHISIDEDANSNSADLNNEQNRGGVKIHRNNEGYKDRYIDFDDRWFKDDNSFSKNEFDSDFENDLDNDLDNDYSDNNQDSDKIGQNDSDKLDDSENDSIDIGESDPDSGKEEESFENSKIVSFNGYKCYDVDVDTCEIEYVIFTKTNEYRAKRGLSTLKANMALSYTARSWSKSQSQMGYISHAGFSAQRTSILRSLDSDTTLDSKIINYLSAENVAATGYTFSSNAAVGESFYTMWINSPGHLANIVGSHTYLGVGVVKTSSGMYHFYATQVFGR